MPRQRWRNFRLTLLRSRSDGDGLGSVLASGEYGALSKGLLTYLKHGNNFMAIDRVQTAIAAAPAAATAKIKSP
jgi:hypothetical protein